jgi:hypothetical protein
MYYCYLILGWFRRRRRRVFLVVLFDFLPPPFDIGLVDVLIGFIGDADGVVVCDGITNLRNFSVKFSPSFVIISPNWG